ncbi:hypothetical protein [Longibaculum muris]|nr:hypothetical protein [Longibaculum muris]
MDELMYSVDLVDEIGNLITNARKNVVKKVNNELLEIRSCYS